MKLLVLPALLLTSCVSSAPVAPAKLESCKAVVEKFAPVGCEQVSGNSGYCGSAGGEILVLSSSPAEFEALAAAGKKQGFKAKGSSGVCSGPAGEYKYGTFVKDETINMTQKGGKLDYKMK